MKTRTDLLGRRFYRLMVLKPGPMKGRDHTWVCRCDCGKTKAFLTSSLTSGRTRSCGCYRKEVMSNRQRSVAGGRNCRRTADELIAQTFATDPRVLLRRMGIGGGR